MLKMKICGVTRLQDALDAAAEGADFVGFIFARSPRTADPGVVRQALRAIPSRVRGVGVFRDQPLGEVRGLLRETGLSVAQLHGSEDPDYAAALGVPVIKTFERLDDETLRRIPDYNALAVLLDLPKDGTGSHDAVRICAAKRHAKVMVAGRLTASSVGALVRSVRPWGVDVAGGVESSPGVKDRVLVRTFIRAARSAAKPRPRSKGRP
jgi:phosphoribosylanthranilate isomerase